MLEVGQLILKLSKGNGRKVERDQSLEGSYRSDKVPYFRKTPSDMQ
jgi:hypothetical protein